MESVSKGRGTLWSTLLVLFTPFLLNIFISSAIAFSTIRAAMAEGKPLSEIRVEVACNLYKYSFLWSVIEVGLGLCLARAMGGWAWLKEQFSLEDFSSNPVRSLLLILALFAVSHGLIMSEQLIQADMEYWRKVARALPLWSKLYLVAIAPLIAGIFEEVIWRGYGINRLEQHLGTGKAVVVQAIAFGFLHGISLHTLVAAIIGLIYGVVYVKRRRLLNISIAHMVTDVMGFCVAFTVAA